MYIVAYVLSWITGIVVFLTAKPSEKRLRFNGLQAVFLGIVGFILYFVPLVGGILALLIWILGIVAGVRAYQDQDMVIPVIGDFAKKYSA